MATQEIAVAEAGTAQRLIYRSSKIRREPLVLFASIIALMCCSLELELLEQVDSMTWYMSFREILWDTSVALLILLVMAMIWGLCVLLIAKLMDLAPSTRRHATAFFWRLGLVVPLSYFVIDLFKSSRLRFLPHWHLGPGGWLCLSPALLLLCVIVLWKAELSRVQGFCRTRLVPIGWLHLLLAVAASVALWVHGVHVFHDFVHPGKGGTASNLPDVYLITIDALRAEDMSLYGYARGTTPNLERFAQHAFTFDYFFANSNFTTATTTSIETGKLPWTHRVFQLGGFLRGLGEQENLGALLRQRGYYTSVISANPVASPVQHRTQTSYDAVEVPLPKAGFAAFTRYSNLVGLNTLYTLDAALLKSLASVRLYLNYWIWNDRFPSPAEPVFDRTRSLVQDANIAQPRFIWTHILPPHDPYLAPLPYRGRFLSSSKLTHTYDFLGLGNDSLPPGVSVTELRLRYDEDVAYADAAVGSFLDWLNQTGRLDRSIVIISADHGESFERGWFKHTGPYLYDNLIRIPLLIHLPGQTEGSRIRQSAEQIDLLPTILDLVGGQIPSWSEGTSLVPTLQGKPLPSRLLFSMNLEKSSIFEPIAKGTIAVIDQNYKYIEQLGTHNISLYRYRTDPFERQDLVQSEPAIAASMRDLLANKLREVNSRTIPSL
jgi:arylsulfatase A-like enzyme